MAKYVIDDSTLTNIADPVRTLMGLTGGLTPANMKTQLDSANTAVTSQTDLIAQITAALEGKAGIGGGSFATGEITVAEQYNPTSLYITGLDFLPDHIIWIVKASDGVNDNNYLYGYRPMGAGYTSLLEKKYAAYRSGTSSTSTYNQYLVFGDYSSIASTKDKVHLQQYFQYAGSVPAGTTIIWVAWQDGR